MTIAEQPRCLTQIHMPWWQFCTSFPGNLLCHSKGSGNPGDETGSCWTAASISGPSACATDDVAYYPQSETLPLNLKSPPCPGGFPAASESCGQLPPPPPHPRLHQQLCPCLNDISGGREFESGAWGRVEFGGYDVSPAWWARLFSLVIMVCRTIHRITTGMNFFSCCSSISLEWEIRSEFPSQVGKQEAYIKYMKSKERQVILRNSKYCPKIWYAEWIDTKITKFGGNKQSKNKSSNSSGSSSF